MTTLTPAQVYSLAQEAGLGRMEAAMATAIAGAESGFRTDAMGDTTIQTGTWGPSVGLWQVRSLKAQFGTGGVRDASRLTDPKFNAASMVAISGGGKNWKPWSTYTSGAYKKYAKDNLVTVSTDNIPGLAQQATGAAADAVSGAVGSAVGGLTAGWGDTALKLLATGVAGALVIVGAIRTVSGGSST